MGHSEGQWQASVLTDTTAEVRMAHASYVRQAQSFTGMVHGCTQILPAKKELITGWLSLLPRGRGGIRSPQAQGERVSFLITLTLDPHIAMLEAGTLFTYNLSNTLGPRKDVCV